MISITIRQTYLCKGKRFFLGGEIYQTFFYKSRSESKWDRQCRFPFICCCNYLSFFVVHTLFNCRSNMLHRTSFRFWYSSHDSRQSRGETKRHKLVLCPRVAISMRYSRCTCSTEIRHNLIPNRITKSTISDRELPRNGFRSSLPRLNLKSTLGHIIRTSSRWLRHLLEIFPLNGDTFNISFLLTKCETRWWIIALI